MSAQSDLPDVSDPLPGFLLSTTIQGAVRDRDLQRLRLLSRNGLGTDQNRQLVWPILLGESDVDLSKNWRSLPSHKDEDQVRLDVDRSFIHYPLNQSPKDLSRRKNELSDLITQVLRLHPYLCYFQGYHDICQVFLLVLGPEAAVPAVARLSVVRIRDFMLPSMKPSLYHLRLLPELVQSEDPKLAKHLSLTQPFFALAATITLYAHEIQEYSDIARLFDAFLARDPIFPVYLFAQIVLARRKELLDIPADEPEVLYSVLSKLPNPLDLDLLLDLTDSLFDRRPPPKLKEWRQVSNSSALKANIDALSTVSMEAGRVAFDRQVIESKRAERIEKMQGVVSRYRKPLRSVGIAVFVGVLSWYLQRRGLPTWFWARGSMLESITRPFRS